MERALLGAALIAVAPLVLAAPASAQSFAAAAISASSGIRGVGFVGTRSAHGVHVHRGSHHGFDNHFPNGSMHDRHDDRDFAFAYPSDYYSDFDGNRSFDPDKWNDWWHERPERSFPRWVWRNRNCSEDRLWWSGAGWRCTP
jgi:hypothetical protein